MKGYHYSCKICLKERKKEGLKYGLEQFLFWESKKEAEEHIKRIHPKEYGELHNSEEQGK